MLDDEVSDQLLQLQKAYPEKTIDEIGNEILRKRIALYEADPDLFEIEIN